jgi:lipid A 3-O-deacylase
MGLLFMRVGPTFGSGIALALLASRALAADFGPAPAYAAPSQPVSFVSELRIGGSAQDPWSPEKGSGNVTGEILFAKPFTPADLFVGYFVPRPHVGGSINFAGKTSFAYAGLTWTVDFTPRWFAEASFGGAFHNGNTEASLAFIPTDRSALGCSPLFRESGSIGYRLSQNWSVMATIEHLSNAGICSQNRGLTNVGARLGYTF